MSEIRENLRWWLHSCADAAFERCLKSQQKDLLSGWWLQIAQQLDRFAAWVGGPLN